MKSNVPVATSEAESDTEPSNAFRARVERRYEGWAERIAARPWTIIIASLAFCAVIAPNARFIEADTHPEEFLVATHPTRVLHAEFKSIFGSDNFILVLIESDSLFEMDFLEWLRDLHDAIEDEVPYVADVTSLINARTTRGEGDELIVEDLFETWPEDQADIEKIRTIVQNTKLHQRLVIGDNERTTAIVIELDPWFVEDDGDELLGGFESDAEEGESAPSTHARITAAHEREMVDALRRILAKRTRPDVTISTAGMPIMNLSIITSMGENITRYLAISLLAIILVLSYLMRRPVGVVLPLVTFLVAILTTAGVIGLRGVAVNMTAQILPSFLLAVGASACIHLLVLFFRAYDAGASRTDALKTALGHAGLPITMACVTTAAGLASFLVSELNIVRDMGALAPIGILFSLLYVLTLIPALLCVLPIPRRGQEHDDAHGPIANAVVAAGDYSVRHPAIVLAVSAVLAIVAGVGATRITIDTNPLDSIEPTDPIHANMALADRVMAGSNTIEILIDTGEVNGLHDPARQRALDAYADWLDAYDDEAPFIRKTLSLNDVLKEIHQALNENRPEFFTTPDDRALIAQELLLFENSGSDDLENFVDSEFRRARFSISSTWGSGAFYEGRLADMVEAAREHFPNSEVNATGLMAIVISSINETQRGMLLSYAIALLTITPLMMLLVGTLRGGLSSMVPNLLPIIIVISVFGWLEEPLEIFATMTASIAIGLAVDDTIHFFHAFYREFAATGDTRLSVRRTLESTGRALLTTTIVLSIGFSVFMFSSILPLQLFGLATTSAILLAFLADILIAPALVTLATRNRQRQGVAPIR